MTDGDVDEPHPWIHVHGGGGRDDVKAWVAKGEATGTYPRTLEHAHPGLAALAPTWVAIMEPWADSPGDALTDAQQVALLWEVGAPDGIDIYDTAADLPADRRTKIDHVVDEGDWNNLSDITGWQHPTSKEGDFTISLFGELGDGLLATFIGFHTEHGSVRHLSPRHQPERLIVAAADGESRPFVVRLTPGTGCPLADRLKQRILAEVIVDQHTRLQGVTYVDLDSPDED
jgi:hypothetical protein